MLRGHLPDPTWSRYCKETVSMSLLSMLSRVFPPTRNAWQRPTRKSLPTKNCLMRRLVVEQLEDRTCPSSLAFSTYLGGSTNSSFAMAVDASGNSYVAGSTESASFPVTSGAFDTSYKGNVDGFVAKLDASGALLWATYLGGSGENELKALAVDPAGNVYVTGFTRSADFP